MSKLLENGVIQESTSSYASPISIAVNKDGSPHVCLDFRRLNLITRKDSQAIPNIDELIDNLQGKKMLSFGPNARIPPVSTRQITKRLHSIQCWTAMVLRVLSSPVRYHQCQCIVPKNDGMRIKKSIINSVYGVY